MTIKFLTKLVRVHARFNSKMFSFCRYQYFIWKGLDYRQIKLSSCRLGNCTAFRDSTHVDSSVVADCLAKGITTRLFSCIFTRPKNYVTDSLTKPLWNEVNVSHSIVNTDLNDLRKVTCLRKTLSFW